MPEKKVYLIIFSFIVIIFFFIIFAADIIPTSTDDTDLLQVPEKIADIAGKGKDTVKRSGDISKEEEGGEVSVGCEYYNLVAHGGGTVEGYQGTNSLEALSESAESGYKFIEVDIIKTSDGKFVLAHDWQDLGKFAALLDDNPVDRDTFLSFKLYNKFQPMDVDTLIRFLEDNPQITIITDTKDRDYSSLEYIAKAYPEYINRFIPQVYLFEDYDGIKALGYENIIVTVYAMPQELKENPQEIALAAKRLGVFAVTIPDELMYDADYIEKLELGNIKYYVHTVNVKERAEELLGMGAAGVYTDFLLQDGSGSLRYNDDYKLRRAQEIASINDAVSRLSDEEKNILGACQIYKLGYEITINGGTAELISDDVLVSCFKNERTGNIFLPLSKTVSFLGGENLAYTAGEKSYTFQVENTTFKVMLNRGEYEVVREGVKEAALLNDRITGLGWIVFAPETFYADVFDCSIIKVNDCIVISRGKELSYASVSPLIVKLYKPEFGT